MNSLHSPENVLSGVPESSGSRIRQLVPVVKLSAVILWGAAVLFSPLFPQLPLLFLLLCAVSRKAGLKVRVLMRGARPVLPFLLLIGIIQVFFISRGTGGHPLFAWHFFQIHREDLIFTGRLFARFFTLILLFALFSSVTPLTEISHGTERLFSPFGKNPLAHDISLIVTIMFRFIPILAQEADQITKAQASRGGSFGTWNMGLVKKIRLYIPLIVPLFIAALEQSEILVEAMESRCYEAGTLRTRLDEFRWGKGDRIAFFFIISLFLLLLAGRFYQKEIVSGIFEAASRLFFRRFE